MNTTIFALSHSELGISHFTTDLIILVSACMLIALPAILLRPYMHEREVKSRI